MFTKTRSVQFFPCLKVGGPCTISMKRLIFLFFLLFVLVGCSSWITSAGKNFGSGMTQGAQTEVSNITSTAVDAGAVAVISAITNPDNIAKAQDVEKKLGQPVLDIENKALDNVNKAEDLALAKVLAAEEKLAQQAEKDVKSIIGTSGTALGEQWDSVLAPRLHTEEKQFADLLNTSIKSAFSDIHTELQDVKGTVSQLKNDIIVIELIGGGVLLVVVFSVIGAFGLFFHTRLRKLERDSK